jgi:hypothetical protein
MDLNNVLHVACNYHYRGWMEIFEARVLGENVSFWLKNH